MFCHNTTPSASSPACCFCLSPLHPHLSHISTRVCKAPLTQTTKIWVNTKTSCTAWVQHHWMGLALYMCFGSDFRCLVQAFNHRQSLIPLKSFSSTQREVGTPRARPCCWRDHYSPLSGSTEGAGAQAPCSAQHRTDPRLPVTPPLLLTGAGTTTWPQKNRNKNRFLTYFLAAGSIESGCWSRGGIDHNHTNCTDVLVSWEWHCLSTLAFPAFLLKPFLSLFHHPWHTDLDNFFFFNLCWYHIFFCVYVKQHYFPWFWNQLRTQSFSRNILETAFRKHFQPWIFEDYYIKITSKYEIPLLLVGIVL